MPIAHFYIIALGILFAIDGHLEVAVGILVVGYILGVIFD
jgi:hypothetical protein